MTEHEIVDRLSAQHNVKEKKVLMGMLNQLTLEIEKFPTRQQSATVRLVNDKVIVAGRHEMTQQDPLTIM